MSSPSHDPVTPTREGKPKLGFGSDTGAEDEAEVEKTKTIPIKVADQAGTEITFKIKRNTPLSKLIGAYCKHKEIGDPKNIRFLYDGVRILDGDTAHSLKMDDEDRIDVFLPQHGGGVHQRGANETEEWYS